MSKTLKSVFDEELKDLVIDPKFIRKLNAYRVGFTTRNDDHIKFFGGNLLGVHVVRFTPADRNFWFEEILQTNEAILESALKAARLPTIMANFKVTSDTMNNSIAWLMHAIHNSPKLSPALKHQGKMDAALIMNYKFFTSRLFRYFKYPANPEVAAATYAALSRKFAIKQHCTWNRVFDARAEEIISERSIHYRAITHMDDDIAVRYLIGDSQNRIRDMLKNIIQVQYQFSKDGKKIATSSSTMELDGDSVLKDRTKSAINYSRYINDIVSDRNAFIKEDLCGVIEKLMHTMPPRLFIKTLEWISKEYPQTKSGIALDKLLNETIVHAINYLYSNRQSIRNTGDLASILARLKGTYSSSRNTDPLLLKLREQVEEVVMVATGNKHSGIVASVRTGTLLYIVSRAMTKHYYQVR